MKIETLTDGRRTILKLDGRLDVTWAEHVLNSALELLRGGRHELRMDASGLQYLSSAGIRVLIRIRREVSAVQGSFAIVNPSPFVENALRMSGLGELLECDTPEQDAPDTGTGDVAGAPCSGSAVQKGRGDIDVAGIQVDVHPLGAGAMLRVQATARWRPWTPVQDTDVVNLPFPRPVFGLGIGAAGVDAGDSCSRFGEFAALAGCLSWLPAGGGDTPDYLVEAERFTPSIFAIQGLVAEGAFSHLLRFRPVDKTGLLPLSSLFGQALEVTGADSVAMVCIAEIEGLVGAALSRSPGLMTTADSPGGFPQIRDWMAFCGERVHARHSALLVAFVSRRPDAAVAPYLVPLSSTPGLFAHTHAVVFPFRPLPEGVIDLEPHVRMFFETVEPVDLLHLIEDDRPAVGLGQSTFLRGACWCAPFSAGKGGAL